MAPEHSQWAADDRYSTSMQAGTSRTESMTLGEPMVLLRHRSMYELGDGVMIWIEEEKQVP
jgi:hypothetical protein